jgi:hypothetical protein
MEWRRRINDSKKKIRRINVRDQITNKRRICSWNLERSLHRRRIINYTPLSTIKINYFFIFFSLVENYTLFNLLIKDLKLNWQNNKSIYKIKRLVLFHKMSKVNLVKKLELMIKFLLDSYFIHLVKNHTKVQHLDFFQWEVKVVLKKWRKNLMH